MLDFVFITKKNDTQSFSLTENEYKEFMLMGIKDVGEYANKNFCIEDENYDVEVIELNNENRNKMLDLLNKYIWKLLEKIYKKIDAIANKSSQNMSEFDVVRKFKDFKKSIEDENNNWLSINP